MTEFLLINTILLFLIIVTSLTVLMMRNLFAAVMILSIYSFLMSLVWLNLDAVDVALTEAAVGAGTARRTRRRRRVSLQQRPDSANVEIDSPSTSNSTSEGNRAKMLAKETSSTVAGLRCSRKALSVAEVKASLTEMVKISRGRILAVARRLGPQLVSRENEADIIDDIYLELEDALNSLQVDL